MSTIKPGDVMLTKSCRMVRVLASRDDGAVAMRDYRSRVAVRSVDTDRLSYHSEHELTLVQPPATPQEPEQAQTLNDVFDVFETWARRKGATDTSSVSLGFWAFNEFHAIIGQPLRDWLLSRRASTPSPEGQTTWKDKIAEYRALIVDMQTGTQVRSLRASELREVMAIQGTLRVLLRELDQRFPAPPTPGENR